MVWSPTRFAACLATAAALLPAAHAQHFSQGARPSARVVAKIDNAVTTRLPGSRPNLVNESQVGSRLAASKPLQHLHLVLSASPEQEAALATLMAEQQDKTSPNFHKWLTPETFGEHFGAAPADINAVSSWLSDQGMQVESVAASGRFITFTATAGQIENAFHTEMHNISFQGEAHISNTTEVQVPTALASVVVGVARLNDVKPSRVRGKTSTVQLDGISTVGTPTPLYGTATGTHYITPGDAAVIYNTTPLTSAGIDGSGQTVAILAQSNIDVADVEKFRSMFGLPKNDPTITYVDQDPGFNGDNGEAYLDAEWGGALAPAASVNFIVSSPNYFSGGVDQAALYAVENNIGDIISLSYGGCEYNNGATYTAYWNSLWEEAAAQGQTVFVSSGDSGAAGCTSSSNTYASQSTNGTQYSVNSLGSSAYNVAVGGSMFVDWNPSQYWGATGGTTIPFANALSYVPEAPLNQSRLTTTYLNSASTAYQTGSGVFAAGGGVSIFTARPSWQTGSGIPTNADAILPYSGGTGIATGYTSDGTHRLVPDLVNISANGHDGTLYCASSLCSTSSTNGLNNAGVVGGTSVATPVQAGIQALINQKNGGRQGNILPILYKLANNDYIAGNCQAVLGTTSTSTPTLPASTCNFHDVVTGSITVPNASSGTAGTGFLAGVGFDEASGLGSVNAATLATNFATVSMISTTTTFTLTPTSGITHGAAQNLSVTVTPTSATGTPTGDVSLIAETSTPSGPRVYKLTAGSYSGAVGNAVSSDGSSDTVTSALPAGSYNVHVHYAGDGTYAPSDSTSLPVVIGKESSTVNNQLLAINPSTLATTATTAFTYGGAAIYLSTNISGPSGNGVPTGKVTYTLAGSATGSVTTNLDGQALTYFYSGFAYPSYYLKPNFVALPAGSYTLTTSYAGDSSFASSTASNTFTVAKATSAVTFNGSASISSGDTATYSYAIALAGNSTTAPNTTVYATGTVTFTDGTTGLGSCTLTSGTCAFTTAGIKSAGAHTITATYSGDTNYSTVSSTVTTTVSTLTSTTLALTGSGTATVGYVYTLKATMTPTAATGSVSFYDGSTYLGAGTLASGVYSLALGVSPTTTNGTGGTLSAGTHNFSAVYGGSTTYNGSTGTLSTTIAKSTTTTTVSGPADSTYGQPVIVSAYISRSSNSYAAPAIPLTGTFTVTDSVSGNVVATGTPVYDPGGYHYYVVSAAVSTLAAGSHTLTGAYSGDANFAASTGSLTVAINVAKLTPTVTLSAPATVYNSGASVVLTATIPVAAALAAPTGVVTFYNGPTSLGSSSVTYNSGLGAYVASLTTTSLSSGIHTLTAVLTSDTNYNTASGTLSVQINTNNVWVANGNGTTSAVASSGSAVTPSGLSGGGTAIAIDNTGDVWSLSKSGNSVTEFTKAGATVGTFTASGNIVAPSALAIDGAGVVWIANGATSLAAVTPTGTAVSANPYMPGLSTPSAIKVDASGDLWLTNTGDNSVVEVIGVATPATTPQSVAVQNATPAAKP